MNEIEEMRFKINGKIEVIDDKYVMSEERYKQTIKKLQKKLKEVPEVAKL